MINQIIKYLFWSLILQITESLPFNLGELLLVSLFWFCLFIPFSILTLSSPSLYPSLSVWMQVYHKKALC